MISKKELKEKFRNASAGNSKIDLDCIIDHLLDRLVDGPEEKLVSEKISTAFLETIAELKSQSQNIKPVRRPFLQQSNGKEYRNDYPRDIGQFSDDEESSDHKALHFTELDNKIADVVMNHPLLAAQWDTLGGKSIHILVTGKTGTGKSALINGLMGQKVAVEGDTLDPETSEVHQIKRMVQGVSMSIFDSPGLQDGTKREYEYMQDMQWKCKSVDLVLYAIRMTDQRVHAEDTRAIKKLTKAFGVEFWNRAIFVLTFANEVQDPIDPEDEIKTEAHFKKRLEVWKEFLPEIVEERAKIPAEVLRRIPIIPVGYYNIRDLPGQKYWFTQFWLAALNRMREAGSNGAGYMLEFSKDRIKTSDKTIEQDFEKPIYEQPIVYEE